MNTIIIKRLVIILTQDESSVQQLIDACIQDDDKLYLCVSSPTIKDKPVQIRPWRLSDADFVLDASMPLDPRKTVFVGGVPRPLKAVELAMIMDRLYGGVCYAGIDTDPELKYPKGAGRVAFSNQQSYIAAISARFVQLQHSDIDKRVCFCFAKMITNFIILYIYTIILLAVLFIFFFFHKTNLV